MLRSFIAVLVFAGFLCLASPSWAAPSGNAQARIGLNRTVPAIDFTNVALKEAIDFLREISGANVHVNWRALEAAGIDPTTQINVKLRQVSLRKVLDLVLSEAAGGNATLAFYVDGGVIEVTTKDIADSIMYTVVYDVQDLLFEPPQFDAPPDFNLANESNAGTGQRGGGSRSGGGSRGGGGRNGGGGGLFGPSTGGGGGATQQRDKGAKAEELVTLITETVTPTVWLANGGKATIRYFNGNLIITAPRSVHEQIGGPID